MCYQAMAAGCALVLYTVIRRVVTWQLDRVPIGNRIVMRPCMDMSIFAYQINLTGAWLRRDGPPTPRLSAIVPSFFFDAGPHVGFVRQRRTARSLHAIDDSADT
jgi:hypothetical protein